MKILFAAAVLAALLAAPDPGAAREYPWCAVLHESDGGEITTCGYVSQRQCMETVWGIGGYCRINPYVAAREPPRPVRKRR